MTRSPFHRGAIVCGLLATSVVVVHVASAVAYQPDAPYVDLAEKNRDKWDAEDRRIDQKLDALRQKFGKRPNIIYILADDVGWGEFGCYGGGKLRGTPTPVIDKMAAEGMKFLEFHSEPSCTPTRLAQLTGRYPVRTGVTAVLWPGQKEGLPSEEVTIAEVLSAAGYHTAFWGKWHVGEEPEQGPEHQGFDYAYYNPVNGAPWIWPEMAPMYEAKVVNATGWFYDFPGVEAYREKYGIELPGIYVAHRGQPRKEVGKIHATAMADFENESIKQIVDFIRDKAQSEKPFFINWMTFCQQLAYSPMEYRQRPGVDSRNNQAAQLGLHQTHLKMLLDTLHELKVAENTLIVWASDNGPMTAFWPTSGYTWLRGEKGDVFEGGIRTPAIAWWPGTIESGQDPIDLLHVTDLFTTAARIGGAWEHIPSDRVTDGVDQTALLLLGEGHSRRDYMFHYDGKQVGAVRNGDLKLFIRDSHGGLPPIEVYNIRRDPRETHGAMYNYLWTVTPFQNLLKKHMQMIDKFPHRVLKPQHDTPDQAELTPHD